MEWNVSAGFEAKDGRHQTSGSRGMFLDLLCKQMQFSLQLFSKDVVSNSLAGIMDFLIDWPVIHDELHFISKYHHSANSCRPNISLQGHTFANIPTFDHNENCVICWSMQDSWRRKSKRRSCTLCQDRAIETLGNRSQTQISLTYFGSFWILFDREKSDYYKNRLTRSTIRVRGWKSGDQMSQPTGKKTSRGGDAYVSPSEAAKSTGLGAREETWNNKEHKLGNIMDHHATCLFKVAVVPTRCQVQYIYIFIYILQCFWKIRIYTYWNKSGTSHTSDWHSFSISLTLGELGPRSREARRYWVCRQSQFWYGFPPWPVRITRTAKGKDYCGSIIFIRYPWTMHELWTER